MTIPPDQSAARDAPASFTAAAIQYEPVFGDKERNVAALLRLTTGAARHGARLIVHPEMATTGYCWASREEIAPFVEPIPGPTTERFAALAAAHDCYVVLALPEVSEATGIFYNSAVLVGPQGVVGVYRKTHAYISEPKWAKDGDAGFPVFATPLGRIGIAICQDFVFFESARLPALRGADVVCFPTNWLGDKSPSATWIARAIESGVYVIAANRYGRERGVQFSGGTSIIGPDGGVLAAQDTGDGLACAEVDPARARDKGRGPDGPVDLVADRRPATYGNLTLNTHLWDPVRFHGLYGIRPLPTGCQSRVAVGQFAPRTGEAAANVDRIAALAAIHAEADLLVVPELAVSGSATAVEAAVLAEPIPGPTSDRLRQVAASYGLHIVAGMIERDGDRRFNSAVLVGPAGVVGVYRKLHLSAIDRSWATPGDRGLPTFDLPLGRVGLLIGSDVWFPEATRCLALDGADVIAWPSLVTAPAVQPAGPTSVPLPPPIPTGPTPAHVHLWRERARENNAYVAFANGAAPSMGWSGIFGPTVEGNPDDDALVSGSDDGSAERAVNTASDDLWGTRLKGNLGLRIPFWYDDLQIPWPTEGRSSM